MDKLTLDTNIIRHWAWAEGRSGDEQFGGDKIIREQKRLLYARLRELRDSGKCEFGVTTQLYTDTGLPKGLLPDYMEDMLGDYVPLLVPAISTFPIAFPITFTSDDKLQSICNIVFPRSRPFKEAPKGKRKDTLQLYAHSVTERDYFLTSDTAILAAAGELHSKHGICVISPEDYVALF